MPPRASTAFFPDLWIGVFHEFDTIAGTASRAASPAAAQFLHRIAPDLFILGGQRLDQLLNRRRRVLRASGRATSSKPR
jgi:hypothetical protein